MIRSKIRDICTVAFCAIIMIVVLVFYVEAPKGRYYDCRLAEISPDFPTEVKQKCRELSYGST